MPTATTWPAFKAALVTLLEQQVGTDLVGLWWPSDLTEGEGIYLADVERASGFASIKTGRAFRDEEYRVGFVCQSATVPPRKDDLTAAGSRCAELEGIVDSILADNPTASGLVVSAVVSGAAVTVAEFDRGVAVRSVGAITVTARLT